MLINIRVAEEVSLSIEKLSFYRFDFLARDLLAQVASYTNTLNNLQLLQWCSCQRYLG